MKGRGGDSKDVSYTGHVSTETETDNGTVSLHSVFFRPKSPRRYDLISGFIPLAFLGALQNFGQPITAGDESFLQLTDFQLEYALLIDEGKFL
jgi:hypothetical protein